jgi:hypothetical protein
VAHGRSSCLLPAACGSWLILLMEPHHSKYFLYLYRKAIFAFDLADASLTQMPQKHQWNVLIVVGDISNGIVFPRMI